MNKVQLIATAIAFAFSLFFHSIGYSRSELAMLYFLAGHVIIAGYLGIILLIALMQKIKSERTLPFILICSVMMLGPWVIKINENLPTQMRSNYNSLEIAKYATSGNVKSQYALAKIYYHGSGLLYFTRNGVAKNYQKALMWLIIAKENGTIDDGDDFIKSQDHYEFNEIWNQLMFYGLLSKAEIAEAQHLAKTCLRDGYRDCE